MACRCYWHHRAHCDPCSSGTGERCALGERLWRREILKGVEDGLYVVLVAAGLAFAGLVLGLGINFLRGLP